MRTQGVFCRWRTVALEPLEVNPHANRHPAVSGPVPLPSARPQNPRRLKIQGSDVVLRLLSG